MAAWFAWKTALPRARSGVDELLPATVEPTSRSSSSRRLVPPRMTCLSDRGALAARHPERLAFLSEPQALADFANAFAMRAVVRAAVRG